MSIADRKAREFNRREEDIINAAFDLFAEQGIEFVTIDMIAEKAEVGKGTIYKHFSSKNDIFAVQVIRQSRDFLKMLESVPKEIPIVVRIKKTMRLFWEIRIADMRKHAVYRKCDQLLLMDGMAPEILEEFSRLHNMKKTIIRDLLQKAVDEEVFKDGNVDNFAAVATGLYSGILDLILSGEIKPSEELYELVESMLFKGFMR